MQAAPLPVSYASLIRLSTDTIKIGFARRFASVPTRQKECPHRLLLQVPCLRPVHLSKARFRLCTSAAAQLASDTEAARDHLEATVKATEHLLQRKAIDSSILLQGKDIQTPSSLLSTPATRSRAQRRNSGFGWTSCDQTSWYKQLQQKVHLFKVCTDMICMVWPALIRLTLHYFKCRNLALHTSGSLHQVKQWTDG